MYTVSLMQSEMLFGMKIEWASPSTWLRLSIWRFLWTPLCDFAADTHTHTLNSNSIARLLLHSLWFWMATPDLKTYLRWKHVSLFKFECQRSISFRERKIIVVLFICSRENRSFSTFDCPIEIYHAKKRRFNYSVRSNLTEILFPSFEKDFPTETFNEPNKSANVKMNTLYF